MAPSPMISTLNQMQHQSMIGDQEMRGWEREGKKVV